MKLRLILGWRPLCQWRQRAKPPSELMTCPVIQRASSVSSQVMRRAGSSGSPQRPWGT